MAGGMWLGETEEGGGGCTPGCSADVHSMLWQLCTQLATRGAFVVLTKFALRPALRPAGLVWVSPPVNP